MKPVFTLAFLMFSGLTQAAVTFSAQEIKDHQSKLSVIIPTASKCLERVYDDHLSFHSRWGVSKYYGDRKPEYATRQGRINALRAYGAPTNLIDELTPISCIGLTMKCLAEGFKASGTSNIWDRIYKDLAIEQRFDGTNLQASLRNLGWKIMYWNPDPASNAKWDEEDKKLNPLKPGTVWNPVWGGHAYRYAQVKNKGVYYNLKVDDSTTLVGFKDVQPAAFAKIPFFVGTAHAGYHVFPGSFGDIIEAHSMRTLNSVLNLESSPFNPLATGGGPRWTKIEKYRSGAMAVPPQF